MRKLILTISIIVISIHTTGQNYRNSIIEDGSNNYFEIIKKYEGLMDSLKMLSDKTSKKQVKQFERWSSFWKDRILPDGSFVPADHQYKEWVKNQEYQSRFNTRNSSRNTTWSLVGPTSPPTSAVTYYPGMGRVNTLAFNGNDTNVMYIGSPAGGIWKTTNGGRNWTPKGDSFPNMGVSDIVINPTNTNIIYLATGDADGGHNLSIGVLKSINGGNSWSPTGLSFFLGSNVISKLLIDPNNVNTVFATTRNSIKRTINGGTTWTDVHTDRGVIFNDISYKKGSSTIIYATSKSGRFYISTNNGASWTLASTPSVGRLDMALTAHDNNLILILDENGTVRRSINQGSTWSTVSTITGFNSQGGYNMSIAISPLNKDLILVGGIQGWRSRNGGTTWEKYLDGYWTFGNPYFYVHSDHHDIKFVPGTNMAFSLNDGGIFKGNASLNTDWRDLSSGLAITQYYNVSGTPQNANYLIMGAQDNDIAVYKGPNWTGENPGSDGVASLWDYSNSNIAWVCSQSGVMNRTTNGFTSTQSITTPPGAPFVWELEIHPTIPSTIYGGFNDIYKSIDRGDNWINLNSGAGTIESISISPSNANIIYVSGGSTVKKTTNGGTSWISVVLPQLGNVKSIEIHPSNPTEVYIAYSGYSAGKVYKSTNGGTSWTNITGALPNIPTHKIIYKTGSTNGELFLATDLGVYYRTNTIGNWRKLGRNLPNVIVHDLEIHYTTEKLRAATFGRGVWEASISNSALSSVHSNELPNTSVELYPNPSNNKRFTIKLNELTKESYITIYNTIGSIVKTYTTSNSLEEVDLSEFTGGLYLVKVTNGNQSIVKKIILK